MKKTILIIVVALFMSAFAVAMVSAKPGPDGMCPRGEQFKLTDAQKGEMAPLVAQMNDLQAKMFDVQKAMIQKQVDFGNMTQDQADKCIARMQAHRDHRPDMMGNGHGMPPGPEMMDGPMGPGPIDPPGPEDNQ